ncbi:MAG TPA: hypothetical protein DCS93_10900 [Microscillaceae bacterium]|nr:hypothetical protein [Microscillaceae bacterium]
MNALKHTLLTTIIICCAFDIQAQFSLGVRGGFTRSWEEYGNVSLPDDATIHVDRLQVSGLVYYTFNKYFSIGIEPGFVQRGAACVPGFNGGGGAFVGDTKFLLNYVELPLMAKVNIPIYGKLKVFGKAGYGIARITSANLETAFLGTDQPTIKRPLDLDTDNRYRKWDNGLYGSLGFSFDVGANQLFVESLYYAGQRDFDTSFTSKNRGFHLGIGYMRYF